MVPLALKPFRWPKTGSTRRHTLLHAQEKVFSGLMTSSVPLPDDHWVSAWQIAGTSGHFSLDAAERMLSRPWLLSVDDLGLMAEIAGGAEYVEILLVAVFWSGLPGTPVSSCLVATLPYLGAHRPDVQGVTLDGVIDGDAAPLRLAVFTMPGDILSRLVEGVPVGVSTLSLVSSGASDAMQPTSAEVFNAMELPPGFAGGVCAFLHPDEGGLMMQVQGMMLNDEPYHSGDEAASMTVLSWQAALAPQSTQRGPLPLSGGVSRGSRGLGAAAKRSSAAERSLLVKTAATPLIGGRAPPAKALGLSLSGLGEVPAAARPRRTPRAKDPAVDLTEIHSLLRHLVSRVDSLEGGGASVPPPVSAHQGPATVVPSLLATGRVPPPPGVTMPAPIAASPAAYNAALDSARALLPGAPHVAQVPPPGQGGSSCVSPAV
eukprot:3687043-Amphidinium_carterae.1